MSQTRLLFFGNLQDIAGHSERIVELPADVHNGADLIKWISGDNAPLRSALSAPEVKLAVDHAITDKESELSSPEEIAFLPPFSGG
ncbi:MAG: MoaD/ThiS family protein [Pseudomonadota bacterium]